MLVPQYRISHQIIQKQFCNSRQSSDTQVKNISSDEFDKQIARLHYLHTFGSNQAVVTSAVLCTATICLSSTQIWNLELYLNDTCFHAVALLSHHIHKGGRWVTEQWQSSWRWAFIYWSLWIQKLVYPSRSPTLYMYMHFNGFGFLDVGSVESVGAMHTYYQILLIWQHWAHWPNKYKCHLL